MTPSFPPLLYAAGTSALCNSKTPLLIVTYSWPYYYHYDYYYYQLLLLLIIIITIIILIIITITIMIIITIIIIIITKTIIIIITITIIIPDKIIITTTIIGSTHWTIFQISPLLSRALEGWLRSLLDWRPATRGLIHAIFSFKRI